jgi:hypothetical protein
MKDLILMLAAMLLLAACNNKSATNDISAKKDSSGQVIPLTSSNFDALIDSIKLFKPVELSIKEERADMDHLIPVGYNDRGSFAYFIDQDMGGASGLEFHINAAYDLFKLTAEFDVEMQADSVYYYNRDLIGQALRTAGIRINNSIQRINLAEVEKKYGLRFNRNNMYGPANPDYAPDRKTLSSANLSYVRDGYTVELINQRYTPRDGVWDVYVSDIILAPSKELGMFGYAVIVTESIGFEGYTRKTIKVVSLGDVDG